MAIFSDKILRKNFLYLFVLQMANYIIPLLVIPYLGRVLGADNFGKIMFAQAVVAYFVLFVDFGFNVSATKDIVDTRDDINKMSQVFWDTFLAKGFLVFISGMAFLTIIYFVDRFKEDYLLFLIAFINVVSNFLFPIWLFQGLEKMRHITIINTIPKLLMIFAIFYIVRVPTDYHSALLIQMLAPTLSALISLFLAFKLIKFKKPCVLGAFNKISGSWHIFASSLSSNLYTTTNVVILGFLTNNTAVGIYSGADKIVRALIGLLSSVTQVIFPRINSYYLESRQKCLKFIRKVTIMVMCLCLLIAVLLIYGADVIIEKTFKSGDFSRATLVLRYSSLLPFFSVVNGIIAINYFITFGYRKQLLRIVFTGTVFSLICIWPLVYFFEELGPAICATLTEILIFLLLLSYYKRTEGPLIRI